jgi:subtilisin family serine protease
MILGNQSYGASFDKAIGMKRKLEWSLSCLASMHEMSECILFSETENKPIPGLTIDGDYVLVEILVFKDPQGILESLNGIGFKDGKISKRWISGWALISKLFDLENLSGVEKISPPIRISCSALIGEGAEAMYADIASSEFNLTGNGVRVGIISDSFDKSGTQLQASIDAGELPADTVIIRDLSNPNLIDEGRAMGEIIHDVAPGSGIRFYTGFEGMAEMAEAITELSNAGCDIIVDDVIYLGEPFFADGVIAQAVDQVVADGRLYFSAAGNFKRNAYESAWRSSNIVGMNGSVQFDFNPGTQDKPRLNFVLGSGTAYFILQWQEPYRSLNSIGSPPVGAKTDLDLALYKEWDGSTYSGIGSFYSNIDDDPIEILVVQNWDPHGMAQKISLSILWSGGDPPPTFRLIWIGPIILWDGHLATSSPTMFGHANTNGAIACGAAGYYNTPAFGVDPPLLQSYSSAGGTPILFTGDGDPMYEMREKPDITAPDGANTTFFGQDYDNDGYPNFFGTSAAAPHAAAAAALILERAKNFTPEQIRQFMHRTAIDMDVPGFSWGSGHGLIHAKNAAAKILSDVNSDICVDIRDMWSVWKSSKITPSLLRDDINGSGIVNVDDVDIVIDEFENNGIPCT